VVSKMRLSCLLPQKLWVLCLLSVSGLLATDVFGQKHEVGFGLGVLNYSGDLVRSYQFGNVSPGATLFYRNNLNDAISLRAGMTGGIINGDDTPAFDILAAQRDASFSRGVFEVSSVVEYHFLNYRENIRILNWTPYFFVGGGVALFGNTQAQENNNSDYSNLQLTIPFGLGFKYVLDRQWSLGLEAGVRKTFFDYIDDVSAEDLSIKNYTYGNRHDDDWYYFLGFSLSYTIYTIPCPYQFN